MPERHDRGVLDTSVVVDLDLLDPMVLPREPTITALTLAELSAGPFAATDPAERGRRQARLQQIESALDPLPFDAPAARAYGQLAAIVLAAGRKVRGARAIDLLIAATAVSNELLRYTRNGDDFLGLDALVEIVIV